MGFNLLDSFVTIATNEFDSLVQFYQQLLGQDPCPYFPSVYAEFHLSSLRLGIFQPRDRDLEEFSASAKSRISLCLEVEDLEAAIAFLTAMGYPPAKDIVIASHGREIYAYDPEGNRLILHQAMEK